MNILTFDVEEWFHILDNSSTKSINEWSKFDYRLDQNMNRIFNLLEKHNQKATFFCLGWVAEKFPHIIKKIHNHGYEIGTHSYMHQLAYEQQPNDFRFDLKKSIDILQDLTGSPIECYRAPGFSLVESNKWIIDVLIEEGIKVDCSVFPAPRAHGGLKNFGYSHPNIIVTQNGEIKEFPINLVSLLGKKIIFSGGGYFRLIPLFLHKYLFSKSTNYIMTYFHPRDFDSNQPMIKELSLIRRFKSYYGLNNCLNKLDALIEKYDFIDLNEANNRINWDSVKKIKI